MANVERLIIKLKAEGSENIAGIAGLNIYNEDYDLMDELYISVENWITLTKAENPCILLALVIGFNCDNISVFTDNKNVYNRYNELREKYIYTNA
ncbi:unnamed protein product [Rhizophagus irregularis]|uniref:RNase H type-1 domain-containing protein n=1 Tax=Rhizophagus irregularis TaxID=588596 RepID=A0A2I1HEG5_9GLOM|nr:hypothetical protein RhiirA4_478213 [Rhizophagus irregularis]CAB4443559.1 unnamed protein product [Rhizophagus irregularis]